MCSFNCLFNGKKIICIKFNFHEIFIIFTFLPPFIVSILFLIPFQSFVNFFNTSLFSSVELKTKYLFPLFSLGCRSTLPIIRYKRFALQIFSQSPICCYNVSNIVNINPFVMLFCLLLVCLNQILQYQLCRCIMISSIFDLYLFDFSHL